MPKKTKERIIKNDQLGLFFSFEFSKCFEKITLKLFIVLKIRIAILLITAMKTPMINRYYQNNNRN